MAASGYLEPVTVVGGTGGDPFNVESVSKLKWLQKITLWTDANKARGVQIKFTDSDRVVFGKQVGTSKSFEFKAGERIASLTLWPNTAGTRLAGFTFQTTHKNQFVAKADSAGLPVLVPVAELGDGVCVGAQGRSGDDVDRFGFQFLKPVHSAVTMDVVYSKLDDHGIYTNVLDAYETSNPDPEESQDWNYKANAVIQDHSSWSYNPAVYSQFVQLTLQVPYITTGAGGYWALRKWEKCVGTGNPVDSSTSDDVEWSHSGTLAPGASIALTASTNNGKLDTDWKGNVRITLEGGYTFSYPIVGKYKGVRSSWIQLHFSSSHK